MPHFDPIQTSSLRLHDHPGGTHNASEVATGRASWYRLALGYKAAADRLSVIIARDPWALSTMAAPALFLYRHYIELHLKSLLLDAGELLDDPQVIPPKHYLRTLWDRVRALLNRISPESDDHWFARAEEVVADFDAIDPTSFAFRYPVDTTGAPSLPSSTMITVAVVRSMVAELHVLLDGASTQIDVYMGYKHEQM